jgi:hypothetical protein
MEMPDFRGAKQLMRRTIPQILGIQRRCLPIGSTICNGMAMPPVRAVLIWYHAAFGRI